MPACHRNRVLIATQLRLNTLGACLPIFDHNSMNHGHLDPVQLIKPWMFHKLTCSLKRSTESLIEHSCRDVRIILLIGFLTNGGQSALKFLCQGSRIAWAVIIASQRNLVQPEGPAMDSTISQGEPWANWAFDSCWPCFFGRLRTSLVKKWCSKVESANKLRDVASDFLLRHDQFQSKSLMSPLNLKKKSKGKAREAFLTRTYPSNACLSISRTTDVDSNYQRTNRVPRARAPFDIFAPVAWVFFVKMGVFETRHASPWAAKSNPGRQWAKDQLSCIS